MATRTLNPDACAGSGARWTIRTAGSFAIFDPAGKDVTPRGRKPRAIIAYLSAQNGARIVREKLTNLLWSDRGEAQARASMRQALFEIRQAAEELIRTDRDHLWIEPVQLAIEGSPSEGEIFADLNGISEEFDDWLREERERRIVAETARLAGEVDKLLAEGGGAAAVELVDRMQRLDPYNEDWLRLAMQAEFQAGHPAAIDTNFREFAELLKQDLGISPAAETRALRDRLLEELTRTPEAGQVGAAALPAPEAAPSSALPPAAISGRRVSRKFAAVAAAMGFMLIIAAAAWLYLGRNQLPVVAVEPADSSPESQILARELFVKLGSLANVGSGRWQLVDAASTQSGPNLLFRVAETGSAAELQSNLSLLDGKNNSLLWSREFEFPAGRENDLRQHVSLTAGRVLDCALEARQRGGLSPDVLKQFLNGCAELAETSYEDPEKVAAVMRAVVTRRPGFAPAWARLLMLDVIQLELAVAASVDEGKTRNSLRDDIAAARRVAPDLPEIKLAERYLLPPRNYAEVLALLGELKEQAPDNPQVWLEEAISLARVGRMAESVDSVRRAAELDPLSPAVSSQVVTSLAWAGRIDGAKRELERLERLWPGTGALRDAQFAFHLRYGDPSIAQNLFADIKISAAPNPYLQARLDPSPANVRRLVEKTTRFETANPTRLNSDPLGYAVQALAEFHLKEEVFARLQRYPTGSVVEASYVLFRPALADVRRDPRFMQVARRIGLVEYWTKSDRWPDFCFEPDLPYDCRQEAARLGG